MTLETIIRDANRFLAEETINILQPEDALRPELTGLRFYDAPLFGVAAAEDPLFEKLSEPGVCAPGMTVPKDWVAGAKSVISFFLPFTEEVRADNARDMRAMSAKWQQGRIEGDEALVSLAKHLCGLLNDAGYETVIPSLDPRFKMLAGFCANWSERHTAYIAGLGTFGLSKGLITKKGVAGRFGSLVTALSLPATKREYTGVYDWCTMCGVCQNNCPAGAIDLKRGADLGKDHPTCRTFLNEWRFKAENGKSYYGCGKCQVKTPCETCAPGL